MSRFNTAIIELFEERTGRPFPWHDVLSDEDVESLLWNLADRLLLPPTTNPATIFDHALRRLTITDHDLVRGGPDEDALRDAAADAALAVDDLVLIQDGGSPSRFVRIRLRDLIEFQPLLYLDGEWIVDEQLRWLLCAPHDHRGHVIRLPVR